MIHGGEAHFQTHTLTRFAATCFIDGRIGARAGSVQVPGLVALISGCPSFGV